jgi:hypothetical protein
LYANTRKCWVKISKNTRSNFYFFFSYEIAELRIQELFEPLFKEKWPFSWDTQVSTHCLSFIIWFSRYRFSLYVLYMLIKHYFGSQIYNYMYTCYLEIIKWTNILGQENKQDWIHFLFLDESRKVEPIRME